MKIDHNLDVCFRREDKFFSEVKIRHKLFNCIHKTLPGLALDYSFIFSSQLFLWGISVPSFTLNLCQLLISALSEDKESDWNFLFIINCILCPSYFLCIFQALGYLLPLFILMLPEAQACQNSIRKRKDLKA